MLITRDGAPIECTEVSPDCPVQGTIYGYAPNFAANVAFCAIFGILCLVQLAQLLKWRMWSFGIAVILGAVSEVIGYVGRLILHSNAYSNVGFETQICTLTIAPAFWSAAIYLTLKHQVYLFGRKYSTLKAEWYPYIFVTCDLLSLILQGTGGGLAATATTPHDASIGSDVMLAGIVWQVITLTVFGLLWAQYLWSVKKAPAHQLSVEAENVWMRKNFWIFCSGILVAFVATYARCVYRIAEMAGGWQNSIMQDETTFIIFESAMCAVAVLTLCITHPGHFFKHMNGKYATVNTEDSISLQANSVKENVV
ncbi:hypothetical protein UA08_07453 [Talaromyces atroroseus]|uniref:Sphingoid long-chain base transporter RSB1 n=1 Tax=Talaromyces atroroseus TaxID=1441469 RepID=A0A225A9C9_TALAT|nr:hypothetical protein UA08_07453 [Talaromyces atroroseus]OKL57332.1 hypothetical protein UA08_07453 [Talaromyces atroroseus]